MKISMILAVSRNNVIGSHNRMPWQIPEDLQRLKRLTIGHHLLIGRKSFESIGKPLPGRITIVLTRQKNYPKPASPRSGSCLIAGSLDEALRIAEEAGEEEAFIFGGEQIYRQSLCLADRIYLTRIDHNFEGDAYFPPLGGQWREIEHDHRPDGKPYPYSFFTYEITKEDNDHPADAL